MKHMFNATMLATVCAFALTACGEQKAKETTPPATPAPAAEAPAPAPAPTHEVTPAPVAPEVAPAPAEAPKN
jgi:hypothetical protein